MKLKFDGTKKPAQALVVSDSVVIKTLNDGLDLLANADYLGAKLIVAHADHFSSDFFDLKTGLAGDVLQKFSNYRMKLTIQGYWEDIGSRSLRDFIRECNRGDAINFEPVTSI